MKKIIQFATPAIIGLTLACGGAFAQSNAQTNQNQNQNQNIGQSQAQSQGGTQGAMSAQKSEKEALGPHSLMVTSALKSSMVHLNGLESQIKSLPNAASSTSVQHAKIYQSKLQSDIQTAMTHVQELQNTAQSFPKLKKQNIQKLQAAVSKVSQDQQSILGQLNSPTFLGNKKVAMKDLNSFKKDLNKAIHQAQDVNSQLKLNAKFTS